MNKKLLYIIPLALIEIMIQLGFFWLAPDSRCKWVVYAFLSVATVLHLIISYVLTLIFDIRRSAATIVAGTFVQMMIIVSSILLLVINASARNAVFMMMILLILYIVVIAILGISIEGFLSGNADAPKTSVSEEPVSVHVPSRPRQRAEGCGAERRRTTPPPLPTRH